jgi:hypothetical protein
MRRRTDLREARSPPALSHRSVRWKTNFQHPRTALRQERPIRHAAIRRGAPLTPSDFRNRLVHLPGSAYESGLPAPQRRGRPYVPLIDRRAGQLFAELP